MKTLNLFVDATLWLGVAAILWTISTQAKFLLDGIRLTVSMMHF